MKRSMSPLAIVALLFATFAVEAFDPRDFVTARTAILAVPPGQMDYVTFCKVMPWGDDKTTCQVKSVPSVALLVCRTPDASGKTCKGLIEQEILDLTTIKNGGVEVVPYDPKPLTPLKCSTKPFDPKKPCFGYLAKWIDFKFEGKLSQTFKAGLAAVDLLIKKCREKITGPGGLKITAGHLEKLKAFMVISESPPIYRQICDLQGFFLFAGGFLVMDPQGIEENLPIGGICYDDVNVFPTTKQVLDGLDRMIADFKKPQ